MKKHVFALAILGAALIIVMFTYPTIALNKVQTRANARFNTAYFSYSVILLPDTAKKSAYGSLNKDKGIGPFRDKNVELGTINQKWISEGKGIFTSKCVLCHELDQKKIGPPLRNITKDRAPEYILNMIVNPTIMQKEDTNVKELIKKYNNVLMTELGISNDQARSVLEYLRSVVR